MTWIEPKKNWIRENLPPQSLEVGRSYSIPEVAGMLSVSRQTVYKWLAFDCPEEAVIPPQAWYRLPNGRLRIREWIVIKIQKGEA